MGSNVSADTAEWPCKQGTVCALLRLVHDLGKLCVPGTVLGKQDNLSQTEWESPPPSLIHRSDLGPHQTLSQGSVGDLLNGERSQGH